ncbi:glutamine--fructose-6-phosphate transaminase (isomerizing) [Methanocella arvoryzae]|uniref:Glutamine--fructose-6-phosphate aminotransferase [isomerizing] n=1 Tax=Methanocella arvoryzae (strain DSM 22066 / NBRC 105507 / MRE50) TaxID=351160 RepID=Q0W4I9_METAR|nr:glutamine--fructose-6-phosphate transaminase (isomerizing) [Methanocella arvoryzae]CAJ36704.1 glutamine-fructose-6-phosphate amidotransferase,isomerizing [Methanocella arvoryzae MRE50]
MCGIVGYIGCGKTTEVLLDSLGRLEYRGYDSAGIAVVNGDGVEIIKSAERIARLKEQVPKTLMSSVGIGHTRWATHGKPSQANAHPHRDCTGRIAVVHNGIIENYQELKKELQARGHVFTSETDTEVISHLVEEYYTGNTLRAILEAVQHLRGSFAFALINKDEPDQIIAARKESPLVIGIGDDQFFLASDVTAFLRYTRRAVFLDDGDIAILTPHGLSIKDFNGNSVLREVRIIEWDLEAAEKSGYEHFMLKEIHEQPKSLKDVLSGRINELTGDVELPEIKLTQEQINDIRRIVIVACGTSYHAGLAGKYVLEMLTDVPVSVEIGSEFRYSSSRTDHHTLIIALSQSGETADTAASVKDAVKKGAYVIAVTNTVGSTIARESQSTIYMRCGPEIGVAATKTFTSQLAVMYLLSIYLGRRRNTLNAYNAMKLLSDLKNLPRDAQAVLDQSEAIASYAKIFSRANLFLFVGRHLNYPVALEGALKLKEISYIFSEGFAAGELKHGPLALLTTGVPVIAITTKSPTYEKMISNIKEIKARDASVIAIASEGDEAISQLVDVVIRVPDVGEIVSPILSSIVLQLFAYHVAVCTGCPIDKPRNLAKSVTVE